MEEEKSEVGSTSLQPGDRLSQLHDDLLLRILSELPFREATRTAVLSKRWRHIFPSLPHLRRTSLSVDFPRIYNSLSDTTIAISKSMPADSCLFNLNKLFLKLHSFDERISSSVMFLLNSSPNLEHLVIEAHYICAEDTKRVYITWEAISKLLYTRMFYQAWQVTNIKAEAKPISETYGCA
ncbi:hypothetical protein Cni_G15760 [Canna indica]|uniref:F-box domain-containing protein n=1 Tax=Canna indica TaxID=4628 RepID=A0AAQ3KGN4_9LILI|nr:hypothetical protein Cni_G15760 [Canna indica]